VASCMMSGSPSGSSGVAAGEGGVDGDGVVCQDGADGVARKRRAGRGLENGAQEGINSLDEFGQDDGHVKGTLSGLMGRDGSLDKDFHQGRMLFRNKDFNKSLEYFSCALLKCIQQCPSLASTTCTVDPQDGVRVFVFDRDYGAREWPKYAEQIHLVGILLRNVGIILFKLENYEKSIEFLSSACKLRTTGMETKSYYWKSRSMLKLARYGLALEAIEYGRKLCTWKRRQYLSTRLQRRNNKMQRSQAFQDQLAACRLLYREAFMGLYDFQLLFSEEEPGIGHSVFNLWGVKEVLIKGQRRIIAARSYKEDELIVVCKAMFLDKQSNLDGCIFCKENPSSSALFEPINSIIMERKKRTRHEDLLKRFCHYLIVKNGRDPNEDNIVEDTCFHFAEGMGALTANGEIDHEIVANELMKQKALCEELLGEELEKKKSGEKKTLKSLAPFLSSKGISDEDVIRTRGFRAQPDILNSFVEYCIEEKGKDPFGDSLVAAANEDEELKTLVLRLWDDDGEDRSDEFKLRKLSILYRQTSSAYQNGGEMIFSEDTQDIEGDGKFTGLWYLPSFLQHGCAPNTRRINIGHLCFLQATQNIEADEVLTVRFTQDALLPPGPTQDEDNESTWSEDAETGPKKWTKNVILQERYGISCNCEFCIMGGVHSPTEPPIRKWREVFETKVLPKVSPSSSLSVVQKIYDYTIKLLQKMDVLVSQWLDAQTIINPPTRDTLHKVHFLECYYRFVYALEQRPEREFKLLALGLREQRIKQDCRFQFGMLTLLSKQLLTLKNDQEAAKILLPMETYHIRLNGIDAGGSLVSFTMKSLLALLDFPQSDI